VIVAGDVAALKPAFLWLGGGAETVKLRISVQDLIKALGARVAEGITTLRTDFEKE
jgi:prolyl-tRNA editing enzyme YbaK/EbsC (Cys-tRNA(Pro) deacylase)